MNNKAGNINYFFYLKKKVMKHFTKNRQNRKNQQIEANVVYVNPRINFLMQEGNYSRKATLITITNYESRIMIHSRLYLQEKKNLEFRFCESIS